MGGKRVWLLAALLALGAGEAAAQTRCYIWRDGRRMECDESDRNRDRERIRERERERERDRERRREEERRREREREHARNRARNGWWASREPATFGVRGGYDFQEDGGMAGAQLRIPVAPALAFAPSGDVFFGDTPSEWQVNLDALLRPAALGGLYGGLGAAFLNREFDLVDDSETEVGLNLILGVESGRIRNTTVRPFVEGRWTTADDYDAFRLAAGFNVPISGRR
jgi:hypothetical protein